MTLTVLNVLRSLLINVKFASVHRCEPSQFSDKVLWSHSLMCTLSLLTPQSHTVFFSNCSSATGRIKTPTLPQSFATSIYFFSSQQERTFPSANFATPGPPIVFYHPPFYQSSFVGFKLLSLSISISLSPTHGCNDESRFYASV